MLMYSRNQHNIVILQLKINLKKPKARGREQDNSINQWNWKQKTIEKSVKQKNCFFEKVNKIDQI